MLSYISGYFDFTFNVKPDPTQTNHWQTIGDYPSVSGGESTVKGYDEKYNINEDPEFDAQMVNLPSKAIFDKNEIYQIFFIRMRKKQMRSQRLSLREACPQPCPLSLGLLLDPSLQWFS